jgi:hypothetical protein
VKLLRRAENGCGLGFSCAIRDRDWQGRSPRFVRFVEPFAQPNFRAKLGGIVNIESLVTFSCQIRDGSELDAKLIRGRRFRFAKGKVNADFRLRRRGTAFPQHASGMGNGMLVEFDHHRYETGFRIPSGVLGKSARRHEPFRCERENAKGGRNQHARARWRCRSRRP